MRHKIAGRKLNRTTSHRKAMFSNMANSLFLHEQIKTTLPKAKELRRFAEPLIRYRKPQMLLIVDWHFPSCVIGILLESCSTIWGRTSKTALVDIYESSNVGFARGTMHQWHMFNWWTALLGIQMKIQKLEKIYRLNC